MQRLAIPLSWSGKADNFSMSSSEDVWFCFGSSNIDVLAQVLEEVADQCMLRYRSPCQLPEYTSEGCSKGSKQMAEIEVLATTASKIAIVDV